MLASAREDEGAIGAETGEVTGAVAVTAAGVTATRVPSPRVSRAVRPQRRLVRIARIAARVAGAGAIGIGALVAVAGGAGATAAVVASASRRDPWWS